MANENNIFKNGSIWLKADFHLHTKADNEFTYDGDANQFVKDYIEQLKRENVGVGIITNHNKFDLGEFKARRKKALKDDIYLIAGVEFSCKDGAKGIHILISFSDEWIYNEENRNYIADFITTAFAGIINYYTPPYPNSKFGLNEVVENLDTYKKDYFLIMAHVDDNNGLFSELKGRNLEEFIKSKAFQRNVVGLQKSRNFDNRNRLSEITCSNTPAYVEGSDPNIIEEIGVFRKQKDEN
ncbi:MAG: hypothetical protein NUV86_13105, partial [Candidatus Scalindua sp.]|nr:hypothetical protein [Candidatus Scalindua sp.]MCR4344495.1 hypothetical protein [Candidatus Scalindua sp.]